MRILVNKTSIEALATMCNHCYKNDFENRLVNNFVRKVLERVIPRLSAAARKISQYKAIGATVKSKKNELSLSFNEAEALVLSWSYCLWCEVNPESPEQFICANYFNQYIIS